MFKLPIAPYDWSAVTKRSFHHHLRSLSSSPDDVDARLRYWNAHLLATAGTYQGAEEVVDADRLLRSIDADGLVHDVEINLVAQEVVDTVCRAEVELVFNHL